MVTHLNDVDVFEGDVITKGELLAEGSLTVGAGGLAFGESVASPDSWPSQVRVQVADVTERAAVVAWRAANDPITASKPLLVWRANGSLTGVNEITLDGVNWYAETPLSGDIEMTMAATASYGWLLCQGQLLADAAVNYPALWAAADPVFRSGGSLRLPDLRGRMPMGAGQGTGLTLRNLGDAVGTETVVLTEAQMPIHDHSGNTGSPDRSLNHAHRTAFGGTESSAELAGSDRNLWYSGSGVNLNTSTISSAGTAGVDLVHDHPFTTDEAGGGQAHPNIPPAAIVNFKVKI